MKKGIANNFIWVSIERFGMLGIQFVGTMILARLLLPSDFGLIGILTIFIAISNMFVDSGMGASLIRKKEVTIVDYSTLFIYNSVISIFIYILLFIISPFLADFYGLPIIKNVLRILSITIIFNSFSIVQRIHLTRNLFFKSMSIAVILSTILSTSICVVMAFYGCGVWALVFQQVFQSLFYAIIYFVLVRFIPCICFNVESFKSQFGFGISLFASNLLYTINTNITSSIVGRFFTIQQAGYFYQGNKLYNLPIGIMTTIIDKAAYPVLSKLDNKDEVKKIAVVLSRYIYMLSFPIILISMILSKELIIVILGKQWGEVSWIFSYLCIGGIFMITKSLLRTFIKTFGFASSIFKLEFLSVIIGLILSIISACISFYFMIICFVFSAFISMLIYMFSVSKFLNYSIKMQFFDMLYFVVISLFSASIVYLYSVVFCTYISGFFFLLLGYILGFLIVVLMYLLLKNKEFIGLCKYVFCKR